MASLEGGVAVRLAAPSQHLADHPELYDQITVSSSPLPAANGDRNLFQFVVDIEPEELALEFPIVFQAAWTSKSPFAARAGFYKLDESSGRWSALVDQSIDPQHGTGSAWLSAIHDTAPIFLASPPEAVAQLIGAVAGDDTRFHIEAEEGMIPEYDIRCGYCTEIGECEFGADCSVIVYDPEIRINAAKPGLYALDIDHFLVEQWRQYVYVAPKADLSSWQSVAAAHRPNFVFSRHHETNCATKPAENDLVEIDGDDWEIPEYMPVALRELFADDAVEILFREAWVVLVHAALSGEDAKRYMASHGRHDFVVDAGSYDLRHVVAGSENTVYWHVYTNASAPSRVFLTYWMLYAYDWKSPSLRTASHPLDRESITFELSCKDGDASRCAPDPIAVWYAGHLPEQHMYLLEADGKTIAEKWEGDALRVPWHRVEKSSGRAKAYVAYGSHALFPRKGVYYVDPLDIWPSNKGDEVGGPGGTEAACGDGTVLDYMLKALDTGKIDSTSDESPFLFSGMWVDSSIPGVAGERFPPFLSRFHATSDWADNAEEVNLQWCKDGACLGEVDDPEPDVPPGACDVQSDATGKFSVPAAGSAVSGTFTASGAVADPDKIHAVTVTVDAIEACKFSSFPTNGRTAFDFNIDVDLAGCGAPAGERTLGLWLRDHCQTAVLLDSRKVNYVAQVPPTCGNQAVDGGEDCDGAMLQGVTCTSLNFAGGQLGCAPNCTYDTSDCVGQVCGNGDLEGDEGCDGNEFAGAATCQSEGYDGGDLGCTNCDIDTSSCCDIAYSIDNAEYPTYTSSGAGCAEGGGVTLVASAEQVSSDTLRFHVKKSDGTTWGSPAELYLFVGSGPTCGNAPNISKNSVPVDVGVTIQTIDLDLAGYVGWSKGETKEFWIGKSESGFNAGRASGTIEVTRNSCD